MSIRFLECESISDTLPQMWHETIDQMGSLSFQWRGFVSWITVFFDGPPVQAQHPGDRVQTHPYFLIQFIDPFFCLPLCLVYKTIKKTFRKEQSDGPREIATFENHQDFRKWLEKDATDQSFC